MEVLCLLVCLYLRFLNEKKLISQASLASMTLPESNDPTKPKMKGFKVACTVESI